SPISAVRGAEPGNGMAASGVVSDRACPQKEQKEGGGAGELQQAATARTGDWHGSLRMHVPGRRASHPASGLRWREIPSGPSFLRTRNRIAECRQERERNRGRSWWERKLRLQQQFGLPGPRSGRIPAIA